MLNFVHLFIASHFTDLNVLRHGTPGGGISPVAMSTDKIERLEARCDDLQATVDQLLRHVAALESQQRPGVGEQVKDVGSFDLTMTMEQASAGRAARDPKH